MKAVFPLLLLVATPAAAQDQEDAAHRADRLATQALNQRSPSGYITTPHAARRDPARADPGSDDYAAAQAEYRRRLADWRRRVAACQAGYYDACQQ